MLLSKPKKSYKSVSKTELIPESRKSSYTHQENHEDIDSFSIYEEIQNINEQVKKYQSNENIFYHNSHSGARELYRKADCQHKI